MIATERETLIVSGIEREMRCLPTSTWVRIGDDAWAKMCGKCDATGSISWGINVDARIGDRVIIQVCFRCNGHGYTGKARTAASLDTAAIREEKAEVARKAKAAAEADFYAEQAKVQQEIEAAREAVKVAERDAKIAASRHLDAVEGEKVQVAGTVTLAHSFEAVSYGGWGTEIKRIVGVDCGAGVTVKMFTTAAWSFEVAVGDTVTIAGTVKSHGEYEGIRETTIVRPRMLSHTPTTEEA